MSQLKPPISKAIILVSRIEFLSKIKGLKLAKAIASKTASDGVFEWTPETTILPQSVI
ncbi:hypothetical protein NDI37_13015 [Funiculus sociatus GB2-A5]|uniref:Uncharacterized protein n=1 Tax=Funiculus sociatus GB2-A5 TaxID=2933946 RepID=A0ABV0JPS9_9CYAN|nr:MULTISPECIES: hypothetical protein [unclassified Trichocoleus]MBD1907758.1 hypothetical protein [Trichocoleus sp. FACHB-832]MBD2065175.1 hypothetical protein [Trichocoleus sp. FACHB-6]